MTMIEKIENKYCIRISDDSFYNPLSGRWIKAYRIYTADGCLWENGLSFRGLQEECRKCGTVFKQIAERIEINV